MRKVWILVANGTKATVYKAENTNTLVSIKQFQHLEGHLHGRDLTSDRPGHSSSGSDTFAERTPIKVKEADHFAQVLADFLEEGHKKNEFERIYLIIKSPFLGHIQNALSSGVSKMVVSEIHKDLTHLNQNEIREYLPPVL